MARALEDALAAAGWDWIVDTDASVAFGGGFEPMPDITVWDSGEGDASGGGPIPGAAVRLIVEVADSTLADDLGEKLEDYAAAGLAEYWVADVQGKLILQHSEPSAATGEKPGYGSPRALALRGDDRLADAPGDRGRDVAFAYSSVNSPRERRAQRPALSSRGWSRSMMERCSSTG